MAHLSEQSIWVPLTSLPWSTGHSIYPLGCGLLVGTPDYLVGHCCPPSCSHFQALFLAYQLILDVLQQCNWPAHHQVPMGPLSDRVFEFPFIRPLSCLQTLIFPLGCRFLVGITLLQVYIVVASFSGLVLSLNFSPYSFSWFHPSPLLTTIPHYFNNFSVPLLDPIK